MDDLGNLRVRRSASLLAAIQGDIVVEISCGVGIRPGPSNAPGVLLSLGPHVLFRPVFETGELDAEVLRVLWPGRLTAHIEPLM